MDICFYFYFSLLPWKLVFCTKNYPSIVRVVWLFLWYSNCYYIYCSLLTIGRCKEIFLCFLLCPFSSFRLFPTSIYLASGWYFFSSFRLLFFVNIPSYSCDPHCMHGVEIANKVYNCIRVSYRFIVSLQHVCLCCYSKSGMSFFCFLLPRERETQPLAN